MQGVVMVVSRTGSWALFRGTELYVLSPCRYFILIKLSIMIVENCFSS